MLVVVVAEAVALVLLGLLVVGLLRSHADILRALHQLGASLDPAESDPVGGRRTLDLVSGGGRRADRPPAPRRTTGALAADITGATLTDEVAALSVTGAPGDTLIAFLSSGCGTCAGFWQAFADPSLRVPGGARVVVVAKDPSEESGSRLAELAPATVPLILSSAAWSDYAVPGSPYFVYVDGPSGAIVGEGTGVTWSQISSLLGQAAADSRRSGGASGAEDDRIAAELSAAGIGPGHTSLYAPPEAGARQVDA